MSKACPLFPAIFTCLLAICCLTSCQSPKKTSYFQTIIRDTTLQNTITKDFDLKIKPGDQLAISISSASPELSALFNTNVAGEGGIGGYPVDKNGNIQFYKLGEVKVAGLSRSQLRDKLQQDLSPYLKDPLVAVRFGNHRVTVLGEVGSPGVIPINADQITVLEAIGQSGDLTETGKRENVLVIRQTEAGKEFRHLNLLDHSVFSSPYFYLQNEDVIYIEPESKKETQKTQQIISYVLTGFSLLTLLFSRIN